MVNGQSPSWNFGLSWRYTATVTTGILDSDDDIWSQSQLKFWTMMIHGHSDNWHFGLWWWYKVTVKTEMSGSADDTRSQAQLIFWTMMVIHGQSHNWNFRYYHHRLKNHVLQTTYASICRWNGDQIESTVVGPSETASLNLLMATDKE
jgi:hypothetical protein